MDSIISSDNCDTSLLISQIPIPGSVLSADTLIVISVTDDAGNNSILSSYFQCHVFGIFQVISIFLQFLYFQY